MIDGKSVLGVILARGGSKLVPRKNIREVAGKPLMAWTIEAGLASEHVDRLILSSDDSGIAEVARRRGCEVPFLRPNELAAAKRPRLRRAVAAQPRGSRGCSIDALSSSRGAQAGRLRGWNRQPSPARLFAAQEQRIWSR